ALRRTIRGAAQVVMCEVVGGGDDLGDTEIEQPQLAARTDLYVGRLDVAVDDSRLSSIHVGEERVKGAELAAHFYGEAGGALRIEAAVGLQDLGDAFSFEILHGDEEAALLL